ncbi:hypothetical protein Naga_100953g4 [Nannochloropsis gaditana]|uniref:Uncharacterized protein n=1 Tax=Nannochloropsis gaditana TaxID=72520 RepID=W7THD5_9STRA|nr:hypothetical protein Naga_100953g4 [Nannochloropsis gaditana]
MCHSLPHLSVYCPSTALSFSSDRSPDPLGLGRERENLQEVRRQVERSKHGLLIEADGVKSPGTITTATVICRIANGTVRNFCGRKRERQSGERRDKREGRQGRDHVKEEQERKHENVIHVD